MKPLLAFSRVVDAFNERVSYIANWLVLLSCLISAGNAFSRYAFSISSNAWLEIQWYMFGAMVMLGTSYTLRKNEHVRVDIVFSTSDGGISCVIVPEAAITPVAKRWSYP